MMSDRAKLLLVESLLLFVLYLLHRRIRARRSHGDKIPVTRINVIRYSIGSRLLWFAGLLVIPTAVMIFAWLTGSMSGTALIASAAVILFMLLLFNLPIFMTLTSIRPAFITDCFPKELRGHFFEIDGDRLTCVTENWYIFLCDTASFVLHAPDIDFEMPVLKSERSVQTHGKNRIAFISGGYRVFLNNSRTVFVPETISPRLKAWLGSHRQRRKAHDAKSNR